jgi:hypothetical protein
MLFFRSEEALMEWLSSRSASRGATLSIAQLWDLSQRWYHNRLSIDYHGRSIEQVQEIFKEIGLTSSFWQA